MWEGDGAAGRAYIEHVCHVRDLRDVPVQGLVEAGGVLPGAEREARSAQARVGCRGGGLQARREARVCGGTMGQRPGHT